MPFVGEQNGSSTPEPDGVMDGVQYKVTDPKEVAPWAEFGDSPEHGIAKEVLTEPKQSFFARLFGSSQPPVAPAYQAAPTPTDYPTDEEAIAARKAGFGYGSGHESAINQESARILGQKFSGGGQGKRPVSPVFFAKSGAGSYLSEIVSAATNESRSSNLDLTAPENAGIKAKLGNTFAKAALAVNRIPIAALGFDPSRVVMDTEIGDKVTVAGAYSRDVDAIYSNLASPGTLVHESIHRGLNELRKDPSLKPAFDALPKEEYIVRYLMATQAGDPERNTGEAGQAERKFALDTFSGRWGGKQEFQKNIDIIMRAAEQKIAERRPGGPR